MNRFISRVTVGAAALGAFMILGGILLSRDLLPALSLSVLMVILAAVSIDLPYDEVVSLDGAVSVATLVLLGPVPAVLLSIGSRSVATALQGQLLWRRRLPALAFRLLGLMSSYLFLALWTSVAGPPASDAALAVVAVVPFAAVEFLVAQSHAARAMGRPAVALASERLSLLGPLIAAEMSCTVLLIMLWPAMEAWGAVLVLLLLLLIRQSYALLFETRAAYSKTIEVLVDVAESQMASGTGHAERTAETARRIAWGIGIRGKRLEQLGYAALLHDIDLIGQDRDDSGTEVGTGRSALVLSEVRYLGDVAPILLICDGNVRAAQEARDEELEAAFIVALSSDIDSLQNNVPASHTQRVAPLIPATTKGRVTGVAVSLGLPVPAVA